ncbi:MAG: hypothetical protein QXR61_03270 [Candidatus Bathyarchaeia archaeon]
MGRWWISYPIGVMDVNTLEIHGRIVAKKVRKGVWKVLLRKHKRDIYLAYVRADEPNQEDVLDAARPALAEKIGPFMFIDLQRGIKDYELELTLRRGILLFPNVVVRDYRGRIIGAGDLTARYSKRQGGFTLCVCNRYAIRRNLGYLSHERLKIIRGLQLRNLTEAIKLIEKWYNVRITLFRLWT